MMLEIYMMINNNDPLFVLKLLNLQQQKWSITIVLENWKWHHSTTWETVLFRKIKQNCVNIKIKQLKFLCEINWLMSY